MIAAHVGKPKRPRHRCRLRQARLTVTLVAAAAFAAPLVYPGVGMGQGENNLTAVDTVSEPTNDTPANRIAVNKITADDKIVQRLSDVLKATQWFDDVRVKVRDGVVFLDGRAPSEDKSTWAEELARNTEGVAAVVNRLRIDHGVDVSEAIGTMRSSVEGLAGEFFKHSPLLIAGLVTLVLTALASRLSAGLVLRVARKSRLRPSLQDLLQQLTTIGVWAVGLMVAGIIVFPGLTPAKALTVLGLGSVAVGFAFKDIFENFFAGILILWKYPFDRDDFIECGEIRGKIEDITIRMSMIRQVDGQLVVVPNAELFKNPVNILTNHRSRRITVICGVAYDADLDQAAEVIEAAVGRCDTIDRERPIQIFAQEFADSSITFEVSWWAGSTPLKVRASRDEVIRGVRKALRDAGIEIPFPQRTLWLPATVTARLDSTSRGFEHADSERNGGAATHSAGDDA
ncbi:MAG: mechanosensitive ion channel family protein [Pirellulales bacterium]